MRSASLAGQPADKTAAESESEPARPTLKVETHQPSEALIQIIQLLNQLGVKILSIETLEPNLESVFLHLTGKTLRQ